MRPSTTDEVAAIARLCHQHRVPLTVRGGGTGYTGGAVPALGGVVLTMERFTRILEIDEVNLLAVVEPNVVTGDLHVVAMTPVGHYALQFAFSDGHGTGIYSYEYLSELTPPPTDMP